MTLPWNWSRFNAFANHSRWIVRNTNERKVYIFVVLILVNYETKTFFCNNRWFKQFAITVTFVLFMVVFILSRLFSYNHYTFHSIYVKGWVMSFECFKIRYLAPTFKGHSFNYFRLENLNFGFLIAINKPWFTISENFKFNLASLGN